MDDVNILDVMTVWLQDLMKGVRGVEVNPQPDTDSVDVVVGGYQARGNYKPDIKDLLINMTYRPQGYSDPFISAGMDDNGLRINLWSPGDESHGHQYRDTLRLDINDPAQLKTMGRLLNAHVEEALEKIRSWESNE